MELQTTDIIYALNEKQDYLEHLLLLEYAKLTEELAELCQKAEINVDSILNQIVKYC